MVIFIYLVTALLLLAGGLAVLYYWLLALAAHGRPTVPPPASGELSSFAIVIPAHDEEGSISSTLRSCQELDYPRDRFDVVVVADNCADNTAQVARGQGAICLERQDTSRRGKGFALEFAFVHLDFSRYEAVVVLDADCYIDRHALRVFNGYLQRGAKVLQANDMVGNPDESPISYVLAVGNLLENELFYAPKSALGLAVLLRGTGMVLHRDILRQFPWQAHSITEDIEYAITLLRHGQRIHFLQEAAVRSPFPVDVQQLTIQRTRWASGNIGFGKKQALLLIRDGLRRGDWTLVDAGATFLVLSRPLVILSLGLAFGLALVTHAMAPADASLVLAAVAGGMLLLLTVYFLLGIARLGVTAKRLKYLGDMPFIAGRLIFVSLLGVLGVKGNDWARTPR